MRTIELPQEYALVLQQVDEDGEEDFGNLAETLQFDRGRLTHILQALQHKGLIVINRSQWIRLSGKGKRLMNYLWPESHQLSAAY